MDESDLNGALTCARYALAPNLLHYCGPETEGDLLGYVRTETLDKRLVEYLAKFETLYPYLEAIARANKIDNPLDRRVVEAYWVGNELLTKMSERQIHEALTVSQQLSNRLPKKEMKWLLTKIDKKARLHHSFHVLNVFTRTGHRMVAHTTETMDECRISWGQILQNKDIRQYNSGSPPSIGGQALARNWADDTTGLNSVPIVSNSKVQIKTQRLEYKDGKLRLVPANKEVMVIDENLTYRLKPGDWVSVHWGIVCDRLSRPAAEQLNFYTKHHLKLSNETL